MKLRFWIFLLIVTVAAMLNAASISGNITDDQGIAISQCKVILHSQNVLPGNPPHDPGDPGVPENEAVVYTNEQGNYVFNNVAVGSYSLRADKQGYRDQSFIDPVTGDIRVIEIDADEQEVEGVNIVMIRCDGPHDNFGSISGIVKGTDNQPLSGIMVGVAYASQPDSLIPFRYAESRWDGSYHIGGLATDQSYVAKAINNFTMTSISADYPFTLTAQAPMLSNFDISLPYMGYSISGTAYDSQGQPIPHAYIVLYNIVPNTTNSIYLWTGTFADQNGHYTLRHIVPGSYNMALVGHSWTPVFYPSTPDYNSAGVVTVADANVEGIDIHIPVPQMYTVGGYVTDAATSLPLSGIEVRIDRPGMGHHGHGDPSIGGCPADSTNGPDFNTHATTDESGHWSLTIPQGDYVFVAFDPTHTYQAQFYAGANTPFNATHVIVNADMDTVNFALNLIADPGTYSLSGTISENGTIPTYPVMVVAVSSDEDWEDATMTNSDGTYMFHNIHAGNYYVLAYSQAAPPTYYQNVINWESANLVAINGNVVGIDIQLNYTLLSGPSSLSGTVASLGGTPLANVTIALSDNQGNIVTFATTDANGQYSIPDLVNQNYTATVTVLNVPSLETTVTVNGNVSHDFVLNAPTATDDEIQTTPGKA
ncbi:MAG TPA: carboxypeptidase-like regulatory domain-containing protein, partial [Candidatus Cloacimonadota bacterium]|nr:carboxypeptidase-like regulatory domain-containing protein [Candidatus Cloacimonadota bacterium]